MIQINLANSFISKAPTVKAAQGPGAANAIKVALLVVPVACLIFFEKHQLSDKQNKLQTLQQEQAKLTAELTQFGSADDIVRNVSEQKADPEKKVDVLKQIFEGRSRKIQTLFVLQSAIPKTSWLTRVKFEENKVSVEGYATSIDEAQSFAGLLSQEKNLFAEAKATNTVGEQINGGSYYKFTLALVFKE